jgi:UDP-2-acetamido-2,6-beta-L-arabino-hexul-4-ose reductase
MVIGSGMIAKRFSDYAVDNKFLIFASGVSNSVLNDPNSFKRESDLLYDVIKKDSQKTIVYFSTCSIYDPSMKKSAYIHHKLKMEDIIKTSGINYTIFRVSNPIGNTENPNTVLNYFIEHIREKKKFVVWKYASRNLIDIDDMYLVCHYILSKNLFENHKVNIANPVNYSVIYIVQAIEKHFGVKGNYQLADKGNSPLIDTSAIQPILSKLKINFGSSYLSDVLQKYFSQ